MYNNYEDITIVDQLEAENLYDLVCSTVGYLDDHDLHAFYLMLMSNPDKLREFYPYYWANRSFSKEIKYVTDYLERNDPNGDWDEYDVLVTPLQTIETIETWKADLEDAYEDIPGWMDKCIDTLLLFMHLGDTLC